MPLVYAVISFFSYRFFRDYTYYSFVEAGKQFSLHETSNLMTFLRSLRSILFFYIEQFEYSLSSKAVTLSAFLCVTVFLRFSQS